MSVKKEVLEGLPGGDLVIAGIDDLSNGRKTVCSLLVLVASPNMSKLGIKIKEKWQSSLSYEHQLYELLEDEWGDDAYSQYNSLIRKVVSFSRALDCVS